MASKCKVDAVQKRKSGDLSSENKRESVLVLYDYSGHGVSVKKSDVLPLINTTNKEWWKIELEGGKQEYVPANYVKKLGQVSDLQD